MAGIVSHDAKYAKADGPDGAAESATLATMSPRVTRVVVALVILAGLAMAYQHLFSDRARLNRQLNRLEEGLTKTGEESAVAAAASARGVTRILAPGFVLLATPYESATITDPQQVLAGVLRLRQAGRTVDTDLTEREIDLRRGNRTATVLFLATVTVDFGDRRGRDAYRVRTIWREEEGTWLLAEAEVTEAVGDRGGLGIWN